ncbi:hypothetical protein ACVR0O_07620 [Streptococcus caviae]|uniref:hypothetical protein n=1 Tax=Streptococcus sp. 'caviae' TaxID=1915004 RepID=UPI00094B9CC4|nr:hypothetical protein [Streptococcus sp. 'caviae']OLN82996.1 hypothetical protein BMI76_06985 [Streptococcus sp. 'caviae']
MKILENDKNNVYFLVGEENISPKDLTKEHLLKILNNVYENKENIEFPTEEKINEIKNPVEKEIVDQIVKKIHEFADNVDNLKEQINSKFPEIKNEE